MSERISQSPEFITNPPHPSSVEKFIKKTQELVNPSVYVKEKFRIGEGIERSTGVIMVEKNPKKKSECTIFRIREDMPIFDEVSNGYTYPYKQIIIEKNKTESKIALEIGNEVILPYVLSLYSSAAMVDSNLHLERSTQSHRFFRSPANTEDLQEMYSILSGIEKDKKLNRFGKTEEEERREAAEINQIRQLAKGLLRVAGNKSTEDREARIAIFADPDTSDVIKIEGYKSRFGHKMKGLSIEYQPARSGEESSKNPTEAIYVLREDSTFLYHDDKKKKCDSDFSYSKLSTKERVSAELLNPGRATNHRAVSDEDRVGLLDKLNILRQSIDSYPIYQEVFRKRKKLG